jgi:hypothetical protein
MSTSNFQEQYRVRLSDEGKLRNRAEKHIVAYAQRLLAEPTNLTIDQVWEDLADELNRHMHKNPSHGWCRVTGPSTCGRIKGKPHIISRNVAIYGRGRQTYTLLISESVMKDSLNNYAPVD